MSTSKQLLITILLLTEFSLAFAQLNKKLFNYSFEQADSIQQNQQYKLIMVFLHTDWCAYCKQMENSTFSDDQIINKLNEKVIFVSFNPEKYSDDITFKNTTYRYITNYSSKSGLHEITSYLGNINGKISYPSLVLVNYKNELIYRVASYLNKKQMNQLLDLL